MPLFAWLPGVCALCRNFSSPSASVEETQQSDLSVTFAGRTGCRMTRVDAVRMLVCRRCQRGSCSRLHKLPGYEKKTKQCRSENNLRGASRPGRRKPTNSTQRTQDNRKTPHCFLARPCVPLPDSPSHPDPRPVASLGSLLDDQHWHHLSLVLSGSQINFTVDKHAEVLPLAAEFNIQQVGAAALLWRTVLTDRAR